jgi:hypothetical protein
MKHVTRSFIAILAAFSSVVIAQPQSSTSTTVQGVGALVVHEEESQSGRRVRVSTPTMPFRSRPDSTLSLYLECLHPVDSRPQPDRCIVYVFYTAREPKYSLEHNTSFAVEADGKKVLDSMLSNFGTKQDGANVVEPLLGFWAFLVVKAVSEAKELTFILAGERIAVGSSSLDALREMVKYFSAPTGV